VREVTALDRFRDALTAHNCKPRGTAARCPAHDDHNPSLSFGPARDYAGVVVNCQRDCHLDDVLAAVGMKVGDLFDEPRQAKQGYAVVAEYPYHDEDGQVLYVKERRWPKDFRQYVPLPNGGKQWKLGGVRRVLYRLPELRADIEAGRDIYLAEGEKDADRLRQDAYAATTWSDGAWKPGARTRWRPEYTQQLAGARSVIPVRDRDESGQQTVTDIKAELEHHGHNVVILEPIEGKDVSDHLDADHSVDELAAWWPPEPEPGASSAADDEATGRWVNLDQFVDGTYSPPCPDLGAAREDGIQFLYRGLWHTVIALTTAGKTTFALWQVKAVLDSGGHVVYIHFEEATPNGIIHRLKGLGVDGEVIRKRFHWGHVDSPWKWGEMAAEIARLEVAPQLAVLDGINAACGLHGWGVKEPESVGLYRVMFVHPLTKIGAAVLSLGHPPKALNRQSESYGYGAAGWLNDVNGIGYRMTASKTPIGKGAKGSSALYVVKDRYGEVQRWGELQSGDGMPWWYMGQFVVDDTLPEDTSGLLPRTAIHVTVPTKNAEGVGRDKIDDLGEQILTHLRETTGRFETVTGLRDSLRAKKVHLSPNDMKPALERLVNRGLIEWPEAVADRKPRPGWLTDSGIDPEEE
jgi:hypothetical protein